VGLVDALAQNLRLLRFELPREEENPKSEIRNPKPDLVSDFGFRISDLEGISDLERTGP
jgi:hypothetical protein